MLPNAIILGAQKAGTTSLHSGLASHPDIFSVPELKDNDLFADPENSGDPGSKIEPYLRTKKGEPILLHTHVNYMLYDHALRRIRELCADDLKLIIILRAPTERAESAYNYFKKLRRERREIDQAMDYEPGPIQGYSYENNDFTYIEHGFYAHQLDMVKAEFSLDKCLLLDYHDFRKDAAGVGQRILRFLGVDDSIPLNFSEKNVTGQLRSGWVQDLLYTGVVRNFFGSLLDRVSTLDQRTRIKEKISQWNTSSSASADKDSLPPEMRERLYHKFHQDVRRLVDEYGFDPARNWPEYQVEYALPPQ